MSKKGIFIFVLGACLLLSSGQAFAFRVVDGEYVLDKLDDYDLCQQEDYVGTYCQDALDRWLEGHPGDLWQAAKKTRRAMRGAVAFPYFYKAMASDEWSCNDGDLKFSVVDALSGKNEESITGAQEMAFRHCFDEMKQDIMKLRTDKQAFPYICKELKSRDLLSELQARKCSQ